MNNTAIQEYIQIKSQIKELEARKAEIEMDVLDELDSEGGVWLGREGKLSSYGKKVWEYSPTVTALQDRVKLRKKQEEQTGLATIKKVTNVLMFTPSEK